MKSATKVNALREVQSASGEELRPVFGRMLLPSAPQRTAGATIGDRREGVQGRVIIVLLPFTFLRAQMEMFR